MGAKKIAAKSSADQAEKIKSLQEMIATAEKTIISAKAMLAQVQGDDTTNSPLKSKVGFSSPENSGEGKIILGMFDGQIMQGEDGKQYPVPANYASKSKLVEGDTMKLTITENGGFIYKQIGPVERKYLIGIVKQDEYGNYVIQTDQKAYRVLLAAATYFKIEPGDEITIIVPHDEKATWGAIENIVRKGSAENGSVAENSSDIADINDPDRVKSFSEDEMTEEPTEEDEEESDSSDRPSAIELLEKEIQAERKKQSNQDDIADEWTPDIEEIKKEASNKKSVEE